MSLITLKCHKTLVIKITFIKSGHTSYATELLLLQCLFQSNFQYLSVISVIYLTHVHKYQESLNIFIYYFNLFLKDAGFHLAPVIRTQQR